jgi:murein DD-endopeptidase MepM/ murein hydrolase activator NlpD
VRIWIAAVFVLIGANTAAADDESFSYRKPTIETIRPDWLTAGAQASLIAGAAPSEVAAEAALRQINDAVGSHFTGIATSPVPVLLPLDTAALLQDRSADTAKPLADYLSGFAPTRFFQAGPAGYDAVFAVRPDETEDLRGRRPSRPIYVEISASTVLYNLPPAQRARELPVRDVDARFDNVRRLILENYLRYSVEKFGVTYVVAISCFDGSARGRWISCASADRIASKFVNALSFAGGTPPAAQAAAPRAIERPEEVSPVFTYYPAGAILPNTGMGKEGGNADRNVYLAMRFPLKNAPAYVNSQSFMHWGDCDQTGRTPHPQGRKDFPYRCRVNQKSLIFNEGAGENYSYPWRDSFCEHRYFYVGQCPSGRGHQGVDIRAANCVYEDERADRCEPYHDDVVAVRDSMVLRTEKQESLYLTINAPGEHVRVRYLHMNPRHLDAAGMVSGKRLREGETIGLMGNFNRRENFTTYHLHFEMMVPTRMGWVRVNPYMTLIAAYERLIQARGRELAPVPLPAPPPALQDGISAERQQITPVAANIPTPPKRKARPAKHKRR